MAFRLGYIPYLNGTSRVPYPYSTVSTPQLMRLDRLSRYLRSAVFLLYTHTTHPDSLLFHPPFILLQTILLAASLKGKEGKGREGKKREEKQREGKGRDTSNIIGSLIMGAFFLNRYQIAMVRFFMTSKNSLDRSSLR